jgi:CTP synthase
MMWEFPEDCLVIHLTLVPYLSAAGELKTKPTQHSVKALLELGVQPDILVCRTEHELDTELRTKIARFCNVEPKAVIQSIDAKSIYDVPLMMLEEELDKVVLEKLQLPLHEKPNLKTWEDFLYRLKNPLNEVSIGIIGKYVELKDAYKSINEALIHGGASNQTKVSISWIHSEEINEENIAHKITHLDGILVAPGFGSRGINGKILAIQYARENNVPFLGICLGMQCAVIEFARNVLGWKEANTVEIASDTNYPVIDMMTEQKNISDMGGTMRLGAYDCQLTHNSTVFNAYQNNLIQERHRHRFEFNNDYLSDFEKAGMMATGKNPNSGLVEVIEIPSHPWFVGTQYHPEYKSTVDNPHPLFSHFIQAVQKNKQEKNKTVHGSS